VRIAYLDTFSGISGDMTVGALLDLGLQIEHVRDAVRTLALHGVEVWAERTERSGISATKFHVRVDGHHPDADDAREKHVRHGHRPYVAIRDLIAGSALDPRVRERALAIFARLAEAEGAVHGVPVDRVEFHEVGALDAIVDVVGAALGFTHLGVDAVHVASLPVGRGLVTASHGPLPVPGPAVLALLRGWPIRPDDGEGELVTPTGAAIVAGLGTPGPVPALRLDAVGYGSGDRTLADRPNLLRIVLGEPIPALESDEVVVIEATIDDTSPQLYEHVLERLLAAGARDAFLEPVVMKKSRPGVTLRVIADPADRDRLAAIAFAETSTIGVRWTTARRMVLPREIDRVDTPWGTVRVKVACAPDGTVNVAPEYEDCRALALANGVALKTVHQAALAAGLRRHAPPVTTSGAT
jgi:pyridinium-3,5-bisthiocarboxylic acid mononucleotide nickel chelatase